MKRIAPCPKPTLERLYLTDGLSGPAIADRLGVGRTTVVRWMHAYDIPQRDSGKPAVPRPCGPVLARLYKREGLSSVDIGKRFGCSWVTVLRWLSAYDIPLRSGSERAQLAMSHRSYEERLRNSAASRAIIKGRPKTPHDLRQRAATKQHRAKPSPYESALAEAMRKTGFNPVFHFAVDKFNVDLALVERRLAIEVDGGNWHRTSPRKMAQDKAKAAALSAAGWTMLSVRTRRADWIAKGLEQITAASR
jgi:very-short-patch-repair endonuclease